MKKYFSIFLGILVSLPLISQDFGVRIEADYTIKEIKPDKKQSLIVGKVFYDLNREVLVHKQKFPREQILIFKDSSAYVLFNDSLSRMSSSAMTIRFSIYHLLLQSEMEDFGLDKLGFGLLEVDEVGEKVVSKWKHKSGNEGYIALTQSGGLLDGVIFYKQKGVPLVRQYFKDYAQAGRFMFPTKIYEIINTPEGENKKITSHKNIKIDDFEDENDIYDLFDNVIMDVIRSGKID